MTSAYEQAFPKTDVGGFEVKTLPAAKLIASQSDTNYFDEDNGLFRPLFRYIQARDIAMTTPVEAEIQPGVMYFYIGEEAAARELDSTNEVSVHKLPERTVASHGVRGAYSKSNFEEAAEALRAWLADNDRYEATGEARGVFWSAPYVPWFLKRFEVHIPVRFAAE